MSSTGELETTPIGTFGPENINGTLVEFFQIRFVFANDHVHPNDIHGLMLKQQ